MVGIGNQAGDEINEEIEGATMPGMLNLTDVFELVIDGFDDGSFAQQNLVKQLNEGVFHILSALGNQLKTLLKEGLKQRL